MAWVAGAIISFPVVILLKVRGCDRQADAVIETFMNVGEKLGDKGAAVLVGPVKGVTDIGQGAILLIRRKKEEGIERIVDGAVHIGTAI